MDNETPETNAAPDQPLSDADIAARLFLLEHLAVASLSTSCREQMERSGSLNEDGVQQAVESRIAFINHYLQGQAPEFEAAVRRNMVSIFGMAINELNHYVLNRSETPAAASPAQFSFEEIAKARLAVLECFEISNTMLVTDLMARADGLTIEGVRGLLKRQHETTINIVSELPSPIRDIATEYAGEILQIASNNLQRMWEGRERAAAFAAAPGAEKPAKPN